MYVPCKFQMVLFLVIHLQNQCSLIKSLFLMKNKRTNNFTYPCKKCTRKSSFSVLSSFFSSFESLGDHTGYNKDFYPGLDVRPSPAVAFRNNRLPCIVLQEVTAFIFVINVVVLVFIIGWLILGAFLPQEHYPDLFATAKSTVPIVPDFAYKTPLL